MFREAPFPQWVMSLPSTCGGAPFSWQVCPFVCLCEPWAVWTVSPCFSHWVWAGSWAGLWMVVVAYTVYYLPTTTYTAQLAPAALCRQLAAKYCNTVLFSRGLPCYYWAQVKEVLRMAGHKLLLKSKFSNCRCILLLWGRCRDRKQDVSLTLSFNTEQIQPTCYRNWLVILLKLGSLEKVCF